jgi:hypothetical protein
MSILKRLMNVATIIWVLWFILTVILPLWKEDWQIQLLFTEEFFLQFMDELGIFFPSFFGWLVLLLLNYILFQKLTLWHKPEKSK